MVFIKKYIAKYHFSFNFYSLFLILTFIPDVVGVPTSLITNSIWLLRAALAFWIIFSYRNSILKTRWEEKLFFIVAFIYFVNITIDVFLQHYPSGMGSIVDLIGFFLSILVAVSFRRDNSFLSSQSFYFFLISLSIGLVLALFFAKPSPPPLVGRYEANSIVNTINYGKTGCALAIVAIYGFVNFKFKYHKVIFPLLFLLGLISIIRSGSRSPVVILLAVVTFYFLAKRNFLRGLLVVGSFFVVLWLSLDVLIELSESINGDLLTRLLASIEDGDSSGRDTLYLNVLGHIKSSPIFGSFYLIPSGAGKGFYPHNYFLEAFMTTGLIGGIPFVVMVIILFKKSFKLLKEKHKAGWIVLLFLQVFFHGMFSSTLYSAEDFWGLSFLLLSIDLVREKRIKRYRANHLKFLESSQKIITTL